MEVTPAVAVGDPGKGGRANQTATPTLTAQVGGACSIVHVLEWKEGMAILPSSNLKVSDVSGVVKIIRYSVLLHLVVGVGTLQTPPPQSFLSRKAYKLFLTRSFSP